MLHFTHKDLGLRTTALAIDNGFTTPARPSSELLQAGVSVFDKTKQSFKRLKNNPKTRSKQGNGPGNEPKKNEPKKGEAGISGHD